MVRPRWGLKRHFPMMRRSTPKLTAMCEARQSAPHAHTRLGGHQHGGLLDGHSEKTDCPGSGQRGVMLTVLESPPGKGNE